MKYIIISLIMSMSLISCSKATIRNDNPIVKQAIEVMPSEEKTELLFENIYFEFNSAKLNNRAIEALNRVILELSKDKTYIITGHTCIIGSQEYNQSLGQLRADTVKGYLAERNIKSISQSAGETEPQSDIYERNRRAQILKP